MIPLPSALDSAPRRAREPCIGGAETTVETTVETTGGDQLMRLPDGGGTLTCEATSLGEAVVPVSLRTLPAGWVAIAE